MWNAMQKLGLTEEREAQVEAGDEQIGGSEFG
jgi:hypothetical protein